VQPRGWSSWLRRIHHIPCYVSNHLPLTPFIAPLHPGPLNVTIGATQFEIALASRLHEEACRMFQGYQLVQHSLIQQVLEAIYGRYLSRLRNRVTGQVPAEIRLLILNIFLLCGKITPQQLNTKKTDAENMEYQLSESIDIIFLVVEELQELAELVWRSFTPQQIVDCGYLIVSKHRIFRSYIYKRLRRATVDQTRSDFKTFFLEAHQELRDTDMLLNDFGYHLSNEIFEQIVNRLRQEMATDFQPPNDDPPPTQPPLDNPPLVE